MLVFWFIQDITQKKHTILRNYPVIGRLRYLFERQGEYFRQYFFANDREEMPFNRATRAWVYRLAKDEGGIIGFGSTNDMREPGTIIFVNAPFPVLDEELAADAAADRSAQGYCREPFEARSIVNISGMSFGAISAPAVRALSRGAQAGRLLDGYRRGRSVAPSPARAAATSSCRSAPPSTACATRDGELDRRSGRGDRAARAAPSRSSCRRVPSRARAGCCPAAKVTEEIARSAAFRRTAIRSARIAIAISPTSTSCSTRSPDCAS